MNRLELSIPPVQVSSEDRARHWHASGDYHKPAYRQVKDTRHSPQALRTNLVRYWFHVLIRDIDQTKALARTCPDPACVNPFHHQISSRPNQSHHLAKGRSAHSRFLAAKALVDNNRRDLSEEILDGVQSLLATQPTIPLAELVTQFAQAGLNIAAPEILQVLQDHPNLLARLT